jgi:oxepin-CoA hydrolase/3-oxo-5,6-dehydrosuberyl-CoA semialdehyde dehydrogenase
MIVVSFDVNNSNVRRDFLQQTLLIAIDRLTEQTQPLWGKMTAQQMIEHLTWAFELSTGKREIQYNRPDNLTERAKKFLYENKQTPRLFKNPLLDENPPPLRFLNLADSEAALREELNRFFDHFQANPMAIHNHPIFGLSGPEEWERIQYKHCFHHLLQFELIIENGAEHNIAAP